MEKILSLDAERVSSVAQQWPDDFVNDVALRTRVLAGSTAERYLWISTNLEVSTFSSKASAHTFKLENFGLQVINEANYTHTYIIPHDALTGLRATPVHAAGEDSWIAATWELPKGSIDSRIFKPGMAKN